MAENRSREEIIEELREIIGHGTYAEVAPLARELIGDRWPERETLAENASGQEIVDFFQEISKALEELHAILDGEL